MRDVRVMANEVPRSFINAALAGRRSADAKRSDKPRVGWAGGIGHGGDLGVIAEAIKILGDEVQWVFLGMAPPGIDPATIEVYNGVPFDNYAFNLGCLNLDLALAPLEQHDFNDCKSDLRVLEYGSAGFAVLASAGPTYENCPCITRVEENTPQQWVDAIRNALADRDALYSQAESLHEWVTNKRCMDDHLTDRLSSFMPPNVQPFMPMVSLSNVGNLVTVGIELEGLKSYPTVREAWRNAPGTDILYVRQKTSINASQLARLRDCLGTNASVSPITNDGVYPAFGRFMPVSQLMADQIDAAAIVTNHEPIMAPFPSGPCVLLSGTALARFGLPDETRFGNVEFGMADWGSRCCEGGRGHVSAANVYVSTEEGLQQTPTLAKRTLDHLAMWSPGFVNFIHAYQTGSALAEVKEDLDLAINSIFYDALPTDSYTDWASVYDVLNAEDRKAMANAIEDWEHRPHVNVVMPTFNTPVGVLRDAIESVKRQTYPHWSLLIADDASTDSQTVEFLKAASWNDDRVKVIFREENGHICKASNTALEMAQDGWVVFLDHDDLLAEHALFMVVREANLHPEVRFIYSDSDKLDAEGNRTDPYYAPDFSYELLLAQNYITHLSAYRLDGIREIGGFTVGLEGSQDWDLALRYLEQACGAPPDPKLIRHIPAVLYHWRQSPTSTAADIMNKPYAVEAGRKAVMQHLHRTKQPAFVAPNPVIPIFNMVRFLVTDPAPKVTVLIPTKDNADQLLACVGSLLAKTVYGNFDVIVMDNGSTERSAKAALTKLSTTARVRVLKMPGVFNYADMNNRAAKVTDADFLCFLNDDTEIIEQAWLNDMVGLAGRAKVGAVGAKLLYPDNTVQQCGIMFSPDQAPGYSAMHMWQRMSPYAAGQAGRAVITQPCIAVTAACMVIRRSVFEEVGGFDQITFPIDYNDVDLCLRLHKAGYRNIVSTEALIRHHEGQTKRKLTTYRRDDMLQAESRLLALHGDIQDPYVNPNLEFHPSLSTLSKMPVQKVWNRADRRRVLIINGQEKEAKKAFRDGDLPFCASLEGHYLAMTIPTMQHVRAIDVRQDTTAFETILAKLSIDHIVFCGMGDGTLGSIGFFTALARRGWHIEFIPTEQAKTTNDHNYYTADAWDSVWEKFLETINSSDLWVAPATS
jgi:GT2 family glycosyltransferase